MAVPLDPDLWRSASHRNQIQHLTAPFAAGAVDTKLDIAAGTIDVTGYPSHLLREPLVLVTLARTLESSKLQIEATLNPGGTPPAPVLLNLEFAPYTEMGASLPLYCPPVDPNTRTAAGFRIALKLTEFTNEKDTSGRPVSPDAIDQYIEAHLLTGLMGRTLYLLGAEKQRLRRQGREIIAMRSLSSARDSALDRFGSDLGVPRFMDFLSFRKPDPSQRAAIFNKFSFGELKFGAGFTGEIITEPRREPDDEYRRRLAIYYPFLLPNYNQIVELLNGPGEMDHPNRGLLSKLGVEQRFKIVEEDNDLGIAIHIVEAGNAGLRANFLNYVRKTYLIFPNRNLEPDGFHRERPMGQATRHQNEALRSHISQNFDFSFDPNAGIAPMLAMTLDRVGQCRKALGVTTPWKVLRAQDSRRQADGGSSRYELGLGIEVEMPPAEQLDRMADELDNPGRAPATVEIEALLKSMQPKTSSEDPEGHWLLEPCGIQTCHRTKDGRLYLSHLPLHGIEITEVGGTHNPGDTLRLTARYNAPGDPNKNFILMAGLEAALTSWTNSGNEPWTVISDEAATGFWDRAIDPRPTVNEILREAGLTTNKPAADIVRQLKLGPDSGGIPQELFETIRLPASIAQQILRVQEDSLDLLRQLVRLLRENEMSAILPLVTDTEIMLVIGVTGLPGVGLNISERRTSGFRWYVVPIYPGKDARENNPAPADIIGSTGSQTKLRLGRPGLLAVVAIGYNRGRLTDSYQFRVEADTDMVLNLQQYEYLMNLLQHLHPIGIEIDTFAIRQYNVDIDDNGIPQPLTESIAKTFRQFRRARYRGSSNTSGKTD